MYIKLDVKDIPQMVLLVLLHKPPSPKVPDLDGLVVTRADETPRGGIESKCAHECVVPDKCTYTLPCSCIPYFDLTIARAGHDVIVLSIANLYERTSRKLQEQQTTRTLNSIHASPRSPSNVRRQVPRSMSQSIILVSPLALTTKPFCKPMALTGP